MLETETFDYFDDNLRREYVRNGKKSRENAWFYH